MPRESVPLAMRGAHPQGLYHCGLRSACRNVTPGLDECTYNSLFTNTARRPLIQCNTFWYAHVTFVTRFNVNPHLYTRVIGRNDFNLWPVKSKLSESSETFQLDISSRQSFTRLPRPRWTLHCRELAKFKRRYHVCRSSPKSLFTRFDACKCV